MNNNIDANDLSDLFINRAPESAGVFLRDGIAYKVQEGKASGHLYAKPWNEANQTFAYVSGAIYSVRERDRVTYEQAAALGRATGTCQFCNLPLSDEASIEAGMGPVCEKRWFGAGHRAARAKATKAALRLAA